MIRHLLVYRRYIWQTAWNELRYRYAGTGLGVFWNIINPLLEVAIYTFVFTQIFVIRSGGQGDVPFVLFLCIGLFSWLAFAETVVRGSNAFIENSTYLKRLALPAEIFVAKNVLTSSLSFLIVLLLLALFSMISGQTPGWSWLLLPLPVLLLQLLAFGLALTLACLLVFFRDMGEALRAIMELWKWSMPIVYPLALVPLALQPWLLLNPPYVFIQSIRDLFLTQQAPSLLAWGMMLLWVGLFGLTGLLLLRKLHTEIKDTL